MGREAGIYRDKIVIVGVPDIEVDSVYNTMELV